MAGVYSKQGELNLALKLYIESYKLKQDYYQKHPEDCKDLSSSLNNLGIIHKKLGRFEEAVMYFENALKKLSEWIVKQSEVHVTIEELEIQNNWGIALFNLK